MGPPVSISGMEWVNFAANADTDFRSIHPHCIRLQSGDVLGVATVSGTAATGSTSTYAPGAFRLSDGGWTYLDEAGPGSSVSWDSPCLLQLPTGRVLCFHLTRQGLLTVAESQVAVERSDDDGETWTTTSTHALDENLTGNDSVYTRLRAAYSNGQILLVVNPDDSGDGHYLIQLASDDLGATFTTVWQQDPASENFAYPEVLARPEGGFDVYFVDEATDDVHRRSLSSAFSSMEDVSNDTVPIVDTCERDLAVWESEDGTRWLAAPSSSNSGNIPVIVSRDRGDTWAEIGNPTPGVADGGIWLSEDDEVNLENFACCEYRGRTVMLTEVDQATSTHDTYSILALYLGGHSDVTHPTADDIAHGLGGTAGHVAWRLTYVAVEDPANYDDAPYSPIFTATATGAAAGNLTEQGWRLVTTGADHIEYVCDDATLLGSTVGTTDSVVMLVELDIVEDGGGGLGSQDIAFKLRHADGVEDYEVSIRMQETGWQIYDENLPGLVGSAVTVDMTGGVQILLAIGPAGTVRTQYRVVGVDGLPARTWTDAPNVTATNDGVTPNASARLEWGQPGAIGTGATSRWKLVCFTRLEKSWTPGQDLFPRPFSRNPTTLPNGVKVAAVDGPANEGDAWQVDTRHEHPLANVFPQVSPSPRQTFQSEQMSPTVLAWGLNGGDGTASTGTSLCLSLRNTNVRFFILACHDGGGWENVALVVNGYANLRYTRSGDAVTVDTGASTAPGVPWFARDSLRGGYLVLDDGSFIPGTVYPCTIRQNSEGRWSEDEGRRITVIVDQDDVSGAPVSGDCWIVPPDVTVLLHDVLDGDIAKWRITIPDQDYPAADEDRIRIGNIAWGTVVPFGRQYSATRTIETKPNAEVSTRRSGSRVARELGPARRTVEVSWLEGVDQSQLWNATTTSPDTIVATTWADSEPIAVPADTPLLAHALAGEVGPVLPVLYLPRVPIEEGDGSIVYRVMSLPQQTLYARLVSSTRTEVVLGDELESEVARIIGLVLEEEV